MSDRNDAWDDTGEQYITTLEAKLAVAREALEKVLEYSNDPGVVSDARQALQEIEQ